MGTAAATTKLHANMASARKAIKHVEQKMTIGAQNKFWDVVFSQGESLVCVRAMRSVKIARGPLVDIPNFIRVAAAMASATGCGNCGEQAAIAFMKLYELGIRPLDYMVRTNADHAFVVIGRIKSSNPSDPKTWGPDAVVCDPWDEKAYPANEIDLQMYGGKKMEPESWAYLESH